MPALGEACLPPDEPRMSTLAWTCSIDEARHAYASVSMAPRSVAWFLPDTSRKAADRLAMTWQALFC